MADTTPLKPSLRGLFRSLLRVALVVVCATVTLGPSLADDPIANTLVVALGLCFVFLDGTAGGWDGTARGWWQFRNMTATAGADPAQAESAVANMRMVAGELRRWFLLFLIATTTMTLANLLLSKLFSAGEALDNKHVSAGEALENEHVLDVVPTSYGLEDFASHQGITLRAWDYQDMHVRFTLSVTDKDGTHKSIDNWANPGTADPAAAPPTRSSGRIQLMLQDQRFSLKLTRGDGGNMTSSWSLDLPQPPEGEGWQNMGESFFSSARSSAPLTSSTQTLFSRRWVKPLPPDAPPEQKPEEIVIALSATFSRT